MTNFLILQNKLHLATSTWLCQMQYMLDFMKIDLYGSKFVVQKPLPAMILLGFNATVGTMAW